MEYQIKYSERALDDIDDAWNYIAFNLYSIEAADNLKLKIAEKVEALSRSPEMYVKVTKYDNIETKYRRIVIKNYILLYTIDYKEKIVYISRFYYGKSNYLKLI